jgi:hypothetical protein
MPQLATSMLLTHCPVQVCVPDAQTVPTSGLCAESTFTSIGASTGESTAGLSDVVSTVELSTLESLIAASPPSIGATR